MKDTTTYEFTACIGSKTIKHDAVEKYCIGDAMEAIESILEEHMNGDVADDTIVSVGILPEGSANATLVIYEVCEGGQLRFVRIG